MWDLIDRIFGPSMTKELIKEAKKWVGIHEHAGQDSLGVDSFRMAVDSQAVGEPWCAAFVAYCVRATAIRFQKDYSIFLAELCTRMWEKTPSKCKSSKPSVGSVIIWNYPGTIKGHTGIVVSVNKDGTITTIEGNTRSPTDRTLSGTGVYYKTRSQRGSENMVILGYISPFK